MRKYVILLIVLLFWTTIKAQTYVLNGTDATITNSTAGCIFNGIIPNADKPIITKLTISGTVDARDFRIIRDDLTAMSRLDVGNAIIAAYSGTEGTNYGNFTTYDADIFPIRALMGRSTISNVIFPASIVRIGMFALSQSGIRSVNTLPSSLLSIGEGAFYDCAYLTELILPQNLNIIGPKAFAYVNALESVTIPKKTSYIGRSSFDNCNSLKNIYMESDVPARVSLNSEPFDRETRINAKLHVTETAYSNYINNSYWHSFSNILNDYGPVRIYGNTVNIPSATPGFIFGGGIPSVVKQRLTKLTIRGSIDARDMKVIRDEMPLLTTLDLLDASIVAYTGTDGTYPNGTLYTYPDNVFPAYGLYGRSSISTVYFPLSLMREVGQRAFYGSGIQSISTLPSSVATIQEGAFSNCNSLRSVVLPPNLVTIRGKAFYINQSLTTVIIPASVTTIEDGAFDRCPYLLRLYLDSSNPASVTFNAGCFDANSRNTGTLYVPIGRRTAYLSSQWNCFTNIMEGVVRPTVQRGNVMGITTTSATIDATINAMGDFTPVKYGIVWTTRGIPNVDLPTKMEVGSTSLPLTYRSVIVGLTPGTTYTVRTYVTNAAGTSYGTPFSITTNANSGASAIVEGREAFVTNSTAGFIYGGGIPAGVRPSITDLTISGSIDARDLRIIRDEFTNLTNLNLNDATITAYSGTEGTIPGFNINYSANVLPTYALKENPVYAVCLPVSSLTALDDGAFQGCARLTSINIPNSITRIGKYVFSNCISLLEVNIPSSLTALEGYAFYNCSGLSTIYTYPPTAPDLTNSNEVFTNVPRKCFLRVSEGSLDSYSTATQWNAFENIVEGFIPPTVSTQMATEIRATSATLTGTISDLGDVAPALCGIVWSTAPNPTINLLLSKREWISPVVGNYSPSITNLRPGTTYYVRAFTTNNARMPEAGTVYGNEVSFTTNPLPLSVLTPPVVAKKIYDGTTAATLVSNGKLTDVAPADLFNVIISATATFSTETIGTGKTVTVHYTLSGSAASGYIAPDDYILTTGEIDKGLTLNVLNEGLWNSSNLNMNKCHEWDEASSDFVDKFSGDIADQLTIELHSSPYSTVVYTSEPLNLHQNGTVTSEGLSAIAIPPYISDNYYLTVKSRNHLTAASSSMISFNDNAISYDFTDAVTKAFASGSSLSPTKNINNRWFLYAGNVIDEDPSYQEVNMGDLYGIFNNRSAQTNTYGYSSFDLDGNGEVDIIDVYLVFNNRDAIFFIP